MFDKETKKIIDSFMNALILMDDQQREKVREMMPEHICKECWHAKQYSRKKCFHCYDFED